MSRTTRILLPIGLLALGGLAVVALVATRPELERHTIEIPAPIVRIATVAPAEVRFHVRAQGTVMPRTQSDLVAQVPGEVVWTSPALVPGGFFEAGQRLLQIDRVDYEAELESARASVARAESEARRAAKDLGRQRQLADRSVSSESRIDEAENANKVAQAGLREAKAGLGRAERDLARTDVTAPYVGRVRSESVDVGQFVSRGATLAKVYAVDYAEVRLPVPDRELRYLDLPLTYRRPQPVDPDAGSVGVGVGVEGGAPNREKRAGTADEPSTVSGPVVRLRTEFAGREHVWTGHIVRTEGEIDPRSRMVTVVARVEDPYGPADEDGTPRPPLAVGLFVAAEIEGIRVDEAVVLPRSALQGGAGVFVVDGEDRLRLREVEILRTEHEQVVIGSGLEAGERVCVSPMPGGTDGMRVQVESPSELARSGT